MKYDTRLIEKKVNEGFIPESDVEKYLKALPEETDFDVTSYDDLSKEDTTDAPAA